MNTKYESHYKDLEVRDSWSPSQFLDPSVFQYSFILYDHEQHLTSEESQVFPTVEYLKQVIWYAAPDRIAPSYVIPRYDRSVSTLIDNTDWVDHADGVTRSAESKTLLDSISTMTASTIDGYAHPECWQQLRNIFRPEMPKGAEIGKACCLTAEISHYEDTSESDIRSFAQHALQIHSSESMTHVEILQVDFGYIAFSKEHTEPSVLLMSYRDKNAQNQRDQLLYSVIPYLLLAWVKVRELMHHYNAQYLPMVRDSQKLLEYELQEFYVGQQSLDKLEYVSNKLAIRLAEYAELYSRCEDVNETLEINISNVSRLLHDRLWTGKYEDLCNIFLHPLQFYQDQVKADLNYLRHSQEQADRVLESAELMAGIRATKWSRLATIAVSVFTLLAIPQVFPHSPFPESITDFRWKSVLILFGLLAVLAWNSWSKLLLIIRKK